MSDSLFDRIRSIFKKLEPLAVAPPAPEQVTEAPIGADVVDLTMGIDFGTSCTKVVIGDHGWQGRSYAVPVGTGQGGLERFLRATQVNAGGKVETNLKMRLMEQPDSEELRDLVALYLAGVIRDSLKWFFAENAGCYQGRRVAWSLNLGFPAKRIDDGPLATAYRKIAGLAARLGTSTEPLEIASIRSLQSDQEEGATPWTIPANRLKIYPEIAAQLAGYVNSSYRIGGNLVIIDVGAGTLDVSTLILHGNQEADIVSFHVCEVAPLGAFKLLERRIAALGGVAPSLPPLRREDYQSGTVAIPDTLQGLLGGLKASRACEEAFRDASTSFSGEVVGVAEACASLFRKKQRDAHQNANFDPWPGRLRFFFTGGGSRIPFYRRLFVEGYFEQQLVPYTRWQQTPAERRRQGQGLQLEPLPVPQDFKGLPPALVDDFDRLSVAHGLAYGHENLMRITASSHA